MEIDGHDEITGEEIDEVYDKMRDNIAPDELTSAQEDLILARENE